jgi:phosphinothricin acetyltransferase
VSGVTIRTAVADDAAAVADIYNEAFEDRLATFETRVALVPEEVAGWLERGCRSWWPSARRGRRLFARVSPYSDRCVYEGWASTAVYVARAARGAGVRPARCSRRCARRRPARLYKLTSRVFTDNGASRAVHLAAGLRGGRRPAPPRAARRRWKDCVLVERLLGEARATE